MTDKPTCPDCGKETGWFDEDQPYICGMCSAERDRLEPGTGCM